MSRIVFDLEADDLLYGATRIWCCSMYHIDDDELSHYGPDEIDTAIEILKHADYLIGHNIAGFDIPLMEKLYTGFGTFNLDKVRDTYVMSKLLYPARLSHSLEAWGKKVGIYKPEHEDWSRYSHEMEVRCTEDVKINHKVYEYMIENECKKWPMWVRSVVLEGHMHYWQAMQEEYGVGFDKEKAEALVIELDAEIAKVEAELDPILPITIKQKGVTVKKPFKKDGDYIARVKEWFNAAD